MPHSTGNAVVNGSSSPSSKTLSKFSSYPTVASGIDHFKANPLGQKSIDVVNGTYARFGKPVEGLLETPYSYAKPYVNKADELGEKALETVDSKFPIVNEEPGTIYETGKSWVFWPYTYALDAWTDELTKTRKTRQNSSPIFVYIAALISFAMRVISDFLTAVADFTRPRYESSRNTAQEYIDNAGAKAGEVKKYAEDRYAEARKSGEEKYYEARKKAQEVEGQAKDAGEQAKGQAEETGEQAKNQAKETGEQAKSQAKETKEQAKDQANKAKK